MDNMNSNSFSETVNNKSNQDTSFIDLLSMPVDKALGELTKHGGKAIHSIKQAAIDVFQRMADEEYAKMCRPMITMDECITWLKLQKEVYSQAAYFFIYVEQNAAPRNENDLFSVTIALVDAQKKAIPVNSVKKSGFWSSSIITPKNQDIVCMVIPAKTLDIKLLKALNGSSSVLIKL